MEDIDFKAKHKGLLVTHLNVRSLWNKIDMIKTTFNKFNIDIITFSETWLTDLIPNELIDINGYELFRNDRKWNETGIANIKKGGGVCIYLKKDFIFKTDHIPDLETSNLDIECQYLEIVFKNQKNVLIVNIYRPPQGNINNFVKHLDQTLEKIDKSKLDVILLGNMNVDFHKNSDTHTKRVNSFISQNGLVKLISDTTRYGNIKNSCIDQILTNSNHILKSGVSNVNISDHQLVYFIKKKRKDIPTRAEFQGRSYVNYNRDMMRQILNTYDWTEFYGGDDPNILWQLFLRNTIMAIETMCPIKTFKVKRYKEPWITQELLELIKDKDVCMKKAKKTGYDRDWIRAKRLRNECVTKIRKAKSDFINSELDTHKNDSKKFWKNINKIMPIPGKTQKSIQLIDQQINRMIPESDTANYINDFFVNI